MIEAPEGAAFSKTSVSSVWPLDSDHAMPFLSDLCPTLLSAGNKVSGGTLTMHHKPMQQAR